MWASDGHQSGAVREADSDDDCRSDEQQGDDERLRRRLGKFTIGDEMSDLSAPTNHR